jgi:hypothetical protein
MAMNWLKGLVAPAAQYVGQQMQQGADPAQQMQQPGGPPIGGAPSPYGVQPGMQPGIQGAPDQPPPGAAVVPGAGYQPAMQWSSGTRTQKEAMGGGAGAISSGGISGGGVAGGISAGQGASVAVAATGASPAAAGSLEEQCAHLRKDVESLALFARTLLTMLEEAKVVTREQFEATKNRLDMLDGKLDDR